MSPHPYTPVGMDGQGEAGSRTSACIVFEIFHMHTSVLPRRNNAPTASRQHQEEQP